MERDSDTYRVEHLLAWLMAALSIVLGVLGALEAFDIINLGDAILSPDGGTGVADAGLFADGALLLIPAIISAFLALTLHRNEHHERRAAGYPDRSNVPTLGNDGDGLDREDDLWKGEHAGAYLA